MKTIHKLAAVASLALAAGNASATIVLPSAANGLASVLFQIEDTAGDVDTNPNYKRTFILDLTLGGHTGLNYNSFLDGSEGTNGILTWDLSAIGGASFSAYATDTADFKWSVLSGNTRVSSGAGANISLNPNYSAGTAIAPWGALVTAQQAGDFKNVGNAAINNTLLNTGKVGGWFTTASAQLGSAGVADVAGLGNPVNNSVYNQKLGAGLDQLGQGGTGGLLNALGANAIDFFWVTNAATGAATSNSSGTNVATLLGSFSLSDNNVLTWKSVNVSQVPLPGAAWVFLSGMVGMLGLSRRKQTAAV